RFSARADRAHRARLPANRAGDTTHAIDAGRRNEAARAARTGHDRPKALGRSAAAGPSRAGGTEVGRSAGAAAGAGREGCAADPREMTPPSFAPIVQSQNSWAGETCGVRSD